MAVTPTPEAAMVEVTQADRDAAASFIPVYAGWNGPTFAEKTRIGKMDQHDLVQAFARHRLAAIQSAPPVVANAANRISPEWCLKMAALEDGCEIGAGMPDHPLRVPPPVIWGEGALREALIERLAVSFSDKVILRLDIDEEDRRLSLIVDEMRAEIAAAVATAATGGTCAASPDHADIMETIENAADDWQKHGYTSALAEVRDMANVGRALMEALPKGYSYMNCPSEIVSDLQNERDEALATVGTFADGVDGRVERYEAGGGRVIAEFEDDTQMHEILAAVRALQPGAGREDGA